MPLKRVRARRWIAAGADEASARNKPSSVPLRGRIIHLGLPLPAASSGLPGTRAERAAPRPILGLAPGGVYRATPVTRGPVRSYRTLSPLPDPPRGGHRRFAFCGTFRRLTAPGRYPAPCPAELGLSSGGASPSGDPHLRARRKGTLDTHPCSTAPGFNRLRAPSHTSPPSRPPRFSRRRGHGPCRSRAVRTRPAWSPLRGRRPPGRTPAR